ncbi:hypothetical protein [Halarcobacter bivalviorum]|uniref:hypothetical protein n=1 Tax=Halarcobacter bivalviorum TaxID=663364 RepID=UPI00100BCDA8|nr:hypothetical protein [Halarcobacter bivalviorum]RXK07216.1 hypothetical protein CRU97_03660 [Halarcobacter bivalviorum]
MKKLLLIGFCFSFTIILFEIFLRYSPFSNGISPVVYDKDIGMWHKKDFSNYLIKECYKNRYYFDEEGRIKSNYTYDNTKKDVVILGDSQVEALMVENEKIIHNSLYKELNGKFNILNYGLSGTSVTQQLQILKTKVNLKNVDSVIQFIFIENDLNDLDFGNINTTDRPKVHLNFNDIESFDIIYPHNTIKELIRDFLGKFELYVYLKKTIYYYQSFFTFSNVSEEKIKEQSFNLLKEEFKWQQLKGGIYQTKKLLNSLNIRYIIIVYSQFEFQDNYLEKTEKIKNFLNENKIEMLNIVPYLKKLENKGSLSFTCDSHWNGETHIEISKFIKFLF